MGEPIVEQLDTEWRAISDLCDGFDAATWATPVALPGWTVQDCVSHLAGTEWTLSGEPPPAVDISHLEHVLSPFQEITEAPVEHRRSWTGAQVLADFRDITAQRIAQLGAMSTEELDTVGWSPLGEVPYRTFMTVRLFDSWMHEQDVRRAIDRPGHCSGAEVDGALSRFRAAVPFVVGKKAAAPEGSTVVFETPDGDELCWSITVTDGRAKLVGTSTADRPGSVTTTITLPFTTFVALGGGRWTIDEAEGVGGIAVAGDADLGARVLANMAFTP